MSFVKGEPRPALAGRKAGTPNKATVEVKELAAKLLDSDTYRANLQDRLESGDLAPAVEAMLWHYAYGKPKETVEFKGDPDNPLQHHVRFSLTPADIESVKQLVGPVGTSCPLLPENR